MTLEPRVVVVASALVALAYRERGAVTMDRILLRDRPPNNRQSFLLGYGLSEPARRRNASQSHGIGEGRLGDPVPQQFRGDDVHEDVDVAFGGGVTAGDGSEEPRIAGSVAPQDLVQLLTARSDGFPGVSRGVGDGHAPQNRREYRRSP